jgi:glycerol-1-phosphate dehydrogenase [NAD(P)+]
LGGSSFHGNVIVPDEFTFGRCLLSMPGACDTLVSIGSGVVTDVTRLLAYTSGARFVAIPTALSVDAYTSSACPVVEEGLKVTKTVIPPDVVLFDEAILSNAPRRLTAAGFADLLAKTTALADWQLAAELTGEPICEDFIDIEYRGIESLLMGRLEQATGNEEEARNDSQTRDLARGLSLAGILSASWGSSRPASGSEHHVSHFLELKSHEYLSGKFLHGETVAFGTWLINRLYHLAFGDGEEVPNLRSLALTGGIARSSQRSDQRDIVLRRGFGSLAEKLVDPYFDSFYSDEAFVTLCGKLADNFDEIRGRLFRTIPPTDHLEDFFDKVGVPFRPEHFGMSRADVREAVLCAPLVRDRFTILRLLDEMGSLYDYALALGRMQEPVD